MKLTPQQDFDFYVGQWQVTNHRLKQRLKNCDDWEVFEATQHMRLLPGGIGNYDDFIAENWRPNFVGMSLRLFDPRSQCWSIYWLDNLTAGLDLSGSLLPPVVGKFTDGVGIFECDDVLDGTAIRVRYKWSDITANSAYWEQAMSDDAGKTWEVNWTMQMTRMLNKEIA